MRKTVAIIFIALLVLLCGCKSQPIAEKYCDALAQAEKLIGFKLNVPDSVDGSGTKTFRVSGRTLEVCYFDGKVLKAKISKADNLENINGYDYGYTHKADTTADKIDYTLRSSDANSTVHLAEWTNGKYSYLVLLSDGKTTDEMITFCKTIN